MSGDRVLLTGGAGFLGSNLVRALLAEGREVTVLDDLSVGSRAALAGLSRSVRIVAGSVLDPADVRRAMRGSGAVVHLAARSGIAPSVARPELDFATNVQGTFNVLDGARGAGVTKVVFASSGAVLAGARPPLNEEMRPRPLAPYGASKLYGEGLLQAFEGSYGLVGVTLRFANAYGRHSMHKQSVVAAFLRRALAGEPLPVYGTGRQTRDLIHASDIAGAIIKAIALDRGGTFHVGTGIEVSVNELVRMIGHVTGLPVRVERLPKRGGDAPRSFADIGAARRVLRWQPRVDLAEGLADTHRWFVEALGAGRPR